MPMVRCSYSISPGGGPGGSTKPRGSLCRLCVLPLHEVVDQLRRGVRHLDLEALDLVEEVVVEPDGRDCDAETGRRAVERLGDTGQDRAEAAGARRGHARERPD